jgi:hypothetical protein
MTIGGTDCLRRDLSTDWTAWTKVPRGRSLGDVSNIS